MQPTWLHLVVCSLISRSENKTEKNSQSETDWVVLVGIWERSLEGLSGWCRGWCAMKSHQRLAYLPRRSFVKHGKKLTKHQGEWSERQGASWVWASSNGVGLTLSSPAIIKRQVKTSRDVLQDFFHCKMSLLVSPAMLHVRRICSLLTTLPTFAIAEDQQRHLTRLFH